MRRATRETSATRAVLGALLAAVALAALSGCLVRYVVGPRLTGTCDGACDHYVDCRATPDRDGRVRAACIAECPGVLGDADSLMAFESLSCPDAVEFVEGADRRPPGAAPPPSSAATESTETSAHDAR